MPAPPQFVQTVAARTGLSPHVVQAWVQAEGGPTGNPLNIGPGRNYGSAQAAAAAVAHLINTSSYYSGIRDSIRTGNAGREIAAIKQSPWDAGHYGNGVLDRTFAGVGGGVVPPGVPYSGGRTTQQSGPSGASAFLAQLLTRNNAMMGLDMAPVMPRATAQPHSSSTSYTPSAAGFSGGNPSAYRFLATQAGVDLSRVDPKLLAAANAFGQSLGHPLTVLSGYRDVAKQAALYQRYVNSGYNNAYIAAKPGQSNHNRGEALDLAYNGVPLARAFAAALLGHYGLHNSVPGDLPHTTLSGVNG